MAPPLAHHDPARRGPGGARSLRVHTDMRSEKIAEWRADSRVSILGYDAGQKLQIRLTAV